MGREQVVCPECGGTDVQTITEGVACQTAMDIPEFRSYLCTCGCQWSSGEAACRIPDGLRVQYDRIHLKAERFREALAGELSQLLRQNEIAPAVPLQSRVKEWQNLVEKIERKSLNLTTIETLGDLIGLRLILLFRSHTRTVGSIIRDNFEVLDFEDTSERLEPGEFGYRSLHYVVQPPRQWFATPTWREFQGMKAEIQVRTMAQHTWAAAEHELQYKSKEAVPGSARHELASLEAALQNVDKRFEELLKARKTYAEGVNVKTTREKLNIDLLIRILDRLLPPENKTWPEDYSRLLATLIHFGIEDAGQLRELFDKHLGIIIRADTAMTQLVREGRIGAGQEDGASALRGHFYTHAGLVGLMLNREFGQRYRDFVRRQASIWWWKNEIRRK